MEWWLGIKRAFIYNSTDIFWLCISIVSRFIFWWVSMLIVNYKFLIPTMGNFVNDSNIKITVQSPEHQFFNFHKDYKEQIQS